MRSIVRAILRSDECAPVVYTSFKQFASCAAKYALVTSGNYIHSLVRPLLLSRHLLERRQSFDAVIDLHARAYISFADNSASGQAGCTVNLPASKQFYSDATWRVTARSLSNASETAASFLERPNIRSLTTYIILFLCEVIKVLHIFLGKRI